MYMLVLAYSWARPAILAAGKGEGEGEMFLFRFFFFFFFHIYFPFSPVPLFHLHYLFYASLDHSSRQGTLFNRKVLICF